MKEYTRKSLNIRRLLELGDLDIRGIAAQNRTISADDYFSGVEKFIEDIPQLKEVILSVSGLEANALEVKKPEMLQDLGNIKNTLSKIGYGKLNVEIGGICDAINSGNSQLAQILANEVLAKFSAFSDRIKRAYSVKRFANTQEADSDDGAPANMVLLGEALEYFDYLEANRKMRILAVDDVAVVLNTITSILSPYYEVFALKNSSQVELFLTHTTPELFLLDIEMNEVNGFDLVPLIRQFEKHKETPVIFLTGNATIGNLKDAIGLGACDFITKPVNKEVLLEKIEKNIVRKKVY